MGQSTSSQREREEFLHPNSRRFSQLVQDREDRDLLSTQSQGLRQPQTEQPMSHSSVRPSQQQDSQQTQPFATFSRQISAQSIPVRTSSSNDGDTSGRDEIFYEQQEVRPLVHMEDLGMRNAPITHITASPMPRRYSVISRLSSRFLPRYSTTGSPSNDQDEYGEGRAIRRRLSDRFPSRAPHGDHSGRHRFPFIGALTPGSSTSSRSRRRRDIAPISRPFPLMVEGSSPSPNYMAPSLQASTPEEDPPTTQRDPESSITHLSLRSSRLSRVRRSLSVPLDSLLSTNRIHVPRARDVQSPPQRPPRGEVLDDPDFLLPPLSTTDQNLAVNNSALDPTASTGREQIIQGFPTVAEAPELPPVWAESPSWTERWADRGSAGRREARRMPNMLRGRSSRLIRRDDEGPLPRILHLAAAAIAAQLSGTPEQAITNMQAVGADGLDGSLNALFRTLHHATTSAGDGRTAEGGGDTARTSGTLPPLNFLRVFRFVNQTPDGGAPSRNRAEEHAARAAVDDISDTADGRTVTLVVVGVRSVPSEHVGHEDATVPEPSLDTLLSLPIPPSNNDIRTGTGGLLRHADGRPRFPHRRRASMGGLNTFPANYDSQRHQRMLNSSRQGSLDTASLATSASPLALSESPPGPHPPPSTPADPGLSAYSSGTTTPNRRPSSASAVHHPPLPSRDIATQHLREAGILAPDEQVTRAIQQRRRSDSEFARHRDLGAGAARRNGVVEPDDVEPGDPPSQGSRSWLIYVVGTNLSEDHPAFATPSLFTDVSSFLVKLYGPLADLYPTEPYL